MKKNLFKALVTDEANKNYIGTGNTLADILIVGKESAIDMVSQRGQYDMEIANNADDWRSNLSNSITQDKVGSWFDPNPKYNPLYPYKNQQNKIENATNRPNSGTSTTFYNYQKLIDKIYNNGVKSSLINFHEHTFITELSEATGKYSSKVNKKQRKESITERCEFLKHSFYRDFPIVIVAVGHYVRDFDINIESLFDVKFVEQIKSTVDLKTNFINLHYDDLNNPKRMVIHTNQLSIGTTNALISELGSIIKEFLEKR
jgi:hypothetical protein